MATNPDKETGRGQQISQNAVASWCIENRVPIAKISNQFELTKLVKELNVDLIITVAYGHILSSEILALPRYGCINMHYSLLPKYRGAAPVQWAILNGELETGVTIFKLDSGMDTGPIFSQEKLKILPTETTNQLLIRLNNLGVNLLEKTLKEIQSGSQPKAQSESFASHAPKFKKEDGLIDWQLTSDQIFNKFRALSENPGVFTQLNGARVKINGMKVLGSNYLSPGKFKLFDQILKVGTATYDITLTSVTPEGRKNMSGFDFYNGIKDKEGLYFD